MIQHLSQDKQAVGMPNEISEGSKLVASLLQDSQTREPTDLQNTINIEDNTGIRTIE